MTIENAETTFPLGYDVHAAQQDVRDTLVDLEAARDQLRRLRNTEFATVSTEGLQLLGEISQLLIAAKFRARDAQQHLAYAVQNASEIGGA